MRIHIIYVCIHIKYVCIKYHKYVYAICSTCVLIKIIYLPERETDKQTERKTENKREKKRERRQRENFKISVVNITHHYNVFTKL